jgi:N-hydroxyarylamine O-acetyltransferase
MNLDAYLRRIGAPVVSGSGLQTMQRLHRAHRENILFENLDIQAGRDIRLDLDSLQRKLVDGKRGGYCFEHNTLFGAALREVGLPVTTLLARVRRGPPERWVRTHMLLRVAAEEAVWIADVGFGGTGLLDPMLLAEGSESTQGGLTYRLRREGFYWILSMRDAAGATNDLYEFTEEPQTAADVEMANHFTSTHRDSIFRRTLTIQCATAAERTVFRGELLARYRDGMPSEETVVRADVGAMARRVFGIELPDGPLLCDQPPS